MDPADTEPDSEIQVLQEQRLRSRAAFGLPHAQPWPREQHQGCREAPRGDVPLQGGHVRVGRQEPGASPGLALPHVPAAQSPARAAPAKGARDSSALGRSKRRFPRLRCKSKCPCISFALRQPSSTSAGALQQLAPTGRAAPCTPEQCYD